MTDGTNYFSLGYGQSASFAFDYTTINVAGSGVYTLSGAELNRVAYNFTGALTSNRIVIVPNTVQQYWVTNSTTGAFTLEVKTITAGGEFISQGAAAILYSNGAQVVPAETFGVTLPLAISQGGTGAVTAAAALINLGIDPVNGGVF